MVEGKKLIQRQGTERSASESGEKFSGFFINLLTL